MVRAFEEMRGILLSKRELADSMGQLLAAPAPPPKRLIGFLPVEENKGKPAGKAANKLVARRKV